MPVPVPSKPRAKSRPNRVMAAMNVIVMTLSVVLIAWISLDTFKRVDILTNHPYMTFQFWVCVVFIIDFFVGLRYAEDRWRFFRRRLLFLLLSIPYLNIINLTGMHLGQQALYFVRFIPLARGALAVAIVISYLSSNAVTSLFISYISIMILVGYFCSLIFFQSEAGVNPQVDNYGSALWWAAMNMATVGCDINPVTAAGQIVAVILPVSGMVIFPLFTVYLTDFVTRSLKRGRQADDSDGI